MDAPVPGKIAPVHFSEITDAAPNFIDAPNALADIPQMDRQSAPPGVQY
jgi:hypothetical protein